MPNSSANWSAPSSKKRRRCWPSCARRRPPASADAFRRAAHSLKSNSHTFGALKLGEMARTLELGGLVADAAPIDALDAEYARVAAALQELTRG